MASDSLKVVKLKYYQCFESLKSDLELVNHELGAAREERGGGHRASNRCPFRVSI